MKFTLLFVFSILALAVYASRVQYRGINMGGLEFDTDAKSTLTTFWKSQLPYLASVDYWNARKANIIRIPFRWDVLQNPSDPVAWVGPPNSNSWNTDYLNYIIALTNKAVGYGMTVVLDCHQYARYPYSGATDGLLILNGAQTTPAHFKSFWQKFAGVSTFANNPKVWFQLMNEPSPNRDRQGWDSYTAQNAYDLMVAGMEGVRAAGANNKVIVSGTVWSGAHDWVDYMHNADFYMINGNKANGDVFAQGFPNLGDWAIDVHTYFDTDHSGQYLDCHPFTTDPWAPLDQYWSAVNNLNAITQWAKTYNFQLFLGEVGWGDDRDGSNNCYTDANDLLNYLDNNALVDGTTPSASGPWLGWTYWGASVHYQGNLAVYNVEPDYYWCDGNGQTGTNPDAQGANCQTREKWAFTHVFAPGCWFYDPKAPIQNCAQYFGDLVSSSPPSNGAGASNANYKVGPSGSVSLALSSSPSLFMTTVPFGDSTIVSTTSGSSPMFWGNASFTAVAGLADAAGVSFQSKSNPSLYLRHSNFYLWLNNYATDGNPSLFAQDATFYRVTPGLSGVAGTHSFQSKNFPGYWMSQVSESNGQWVKIVSNPTAAQATWNIVSARPKRLAVRSKHVF